MAYEDPYRRNILSSAPLELTAKNERGERAKWVVEYKGDRVWITVFTGIREAPRKGVMSIRVPVSTWYNYMALLEDVINNPNNIIYSVHVKGPKQGGTFKDPYVVYGKLFVGRDTNGTIFLSLYQDNAPKPIKFLIEHSSIRVITDGQGNEIDHIKVTNIAAKAYHYQGTMLVAALAATEYVEEEQKPKSSSSNFKPRSESYTSDTSSGTTSDIDNLF